MGVTARLTTVLKKRRGVEDIATISPLVASKGLSAHETVALAVIMQNRLKPSDLVYSYTVQQDMNRAGFTDLAVSLSLEGLMQKDMKSLSLAMNDHGEEYEGYQVARKSIDWLLSNQSKLVMRKEPRPAQGTRRPAAVEDDEDIPF